MAGAPDSVRLPEPETTGAHPLEALLRQRRCVRAYREAALVQAELGQLLWAAQGITDRQGLRTAPSAGALYPLEIYIAAGRIDGLRAGLYHYRPAGHRLERLLDRDLRGAIARAALGQDWIGEAAAVVIFTAVAARTAHKYGRRAGRYVHIEVGHAAQNLFLQAQALGLATVVVGAFHDDELAGLLGLPRAVEPLLLMPVGQAR